MSDCLIHRLFYTNCMATMPSHSCSCTALKYTVYVVYPAVQHSCREQTENYMYSKGNTCSHFMWLVAMDTVVRLSTFSACVQHAI